MLQKVQPKSKIIFGTDGMRGRADDFNTLGIERMGREIAQQLPKNSTYIIGRDTRESGVKFEQALRAGIENVNRGIIVEDVGVIPTPLLSYMSAKSSIEGGVMITASHNPFYDNGFKFFDKEGRKIPKSLEGELQRAYDSSNVLVFPNQSSDVTRLYTTSKTPRQQYIFEIEEILKKSQFQGKVVIDCANGATSEVAREVFQPRRRGLEFELFANEPNGTNINENCGITNPQFLEHILREGNHELGISFDGDGDRVGFIDELGNQISGDFVLAYLATKLKDEGKLKGGFVVTQYSNLALDAYLQNQGIQVQRVLNGDKAVMERLRKNDWNFGGEHSGHIILDPQLGSGDGIRAAAEVLRYIDPSIPISQQLNNLYTPNPQIQQSFQLPRRIDLLQELPKQTQEIIEEVTKEIVEVGGRILIRPSGTEPKLRMLVESSDTKLNEEIIEKIANQF